MSNMGKVFLVGAGCGTYDLITMRGLELLKTCDTVVYDSLIDLSLLDFVPKNAEKICVGKRAGKHSEKQERINQILVEKAKAGRTVVRLKGGDPFVFGRGGEEILALKEYKIPYSIVPGITSAAAVPELAGIPVTHRRLSRSFHVITGHTAEDMLPENLGAYSKLQGTLVFLMGLKNLRKITETLIAGGMREDTPAAVISNGATKHQRIVRDSVACIAEAVEQADLEAPAVIVIGETARLDFSPTLHLPLEGISVAVTGTKKLADKLSSELSALGAHICRAGELALEEYDECPEFDRALENISNYSWIVLTSMNGVEILFRRLRRLKIDVRKLCGSKFAVIGSGTAQALENRGIIPELVPQIFTSGELGKALCRQVKKDERVLILRAKRGSAELTNALEDAGISYDDIKTYDVRPKNTDGRENTVRTDYITFASASGVHGFFENGGKISESTKIVCIGEITAEALKQYGIMDCKISETASVTGIIQTILEAEK